MKPDARLDGERSAPRIAPRWTDLAHPIVGYAVAVGSVAMAGLARALLGSVLGNRAPWIFFFPAVMATAWAYGLGPGVVSVVVSLLIGTAMFVRYDQPIFPMPPQETILAVLYLCSSGVIVALGAAHHRNLAGLEREASERRKAQESLAESLEMFRGIFDNAQGTAIVLTDTEKRILAWNRGAVATFGWSEREAFGQPVESLLSPGEPLFSIEQTSEDEPVQTERWLLSKEGCRLWGDVMTARLHRPDGRVRGYLIIVRDMTERRRYEELLEQQNVELERRVQERTMELMAANAELEGFTYSVSHDMRAPLRGIAANSAMLIEDYGGDLPAPAQRMLRRLAGSATKMSRLVEDLLTYARLGKQAPSAVPANLSELFQEVVAEESSGGEIHMEVEPGLTAMCDPGLIRMVLQNLVSNAMKYRHPERRLRLAFGRREDGAFYVGDNGIGFDPAYAFKLFEPFERLHRDEEIPGTGIGLANVKRIVARHGGTVGAEGEPNVGSTFWFTLGS